MTDRPTTVLGISAFYHDAAAAVVRDGEVVAAAQQERFSRIKHDPGVPARRHRLLPGERRRWSPTASTAVAYYEKPLTTFVRVLKSYVAAGPKGIRTFADAMAEWSQPQAVDLARDRARHPAASGTRCPTTSSTPSTTSATRLPRSSPRPSSELRS